MARQYRSETSEKVRFSLTTGRTGLQLHAGVIPVTLLEWGVSFDGTNSSATPAQVRLVRQTTGGTMTQVGTGIEYNSAETASFASFRVFATAEPTATTDVYDSHLVTPVGGLFAKQWPLGRDVVLQPGERVGVFVLAGASSAVSGVCSIDFEE